jgi:hypothetical protein
MGTLIGSSKNTLILELIEKSKTMGSLIVRSEKVDTNNDIMTFTFGLKGVQAGGFCCGPDKVFLE